MLDRILHLITNRTNDFVSGIFPANSSYTPGVLPVAVENLRRVLMLHVTTNDYYVVGALAALDSFRWLNENLAETRTFRLEDYRRPVDRFTNFKLIGNQQGPPSVKQNPVKFPVSFGFNVRYADASTLLLTPDTGSMSAVPVTVIGTVVQPAWPAALGINGAIQLPDGQAWDTTFTGRLDHVPVNFPYEAVAAVLDANTDKNGLLLHQDLINAYFRAPTAMEKVAVSVLVLGLSNPQA